MQIKKVALFFLMMVPFVGFAQPTKTVLSKAKVEKTKPSLGRAWSGSASYIVSTDLAKSGERRAYRHIFNTSLSYEISKQLSLSTGTALNWISEGQNVSNQQDNPSWDDLDLTLSYLDTYNSMISYSAAVSNGFPTGNDSRNEGIRDTVSLTSGLSLSFLDKLITWSNSLQGTKFFQTYDYSVLEAESNVDTTTGFSTAIRIAAARGLTLSLTQTWGSVKLINNEMKAKSSARIGMTYGFGRFGFSFGHALGSYDRSDGYKFLFIDETKRSYNIGVSIEI